MHILTIFMHFSVDFSKSARNVLGIARRMLEKCKIDTFVHICTLMSATTFSEQSQPLLNTPIHVSFQKRAFFYVCRHNSHGFGEAPSSARMTFPTNANILDDFTGVEWNQNHEAIL